MDEDLLSSGSGSPRGRTRRARPLRKSVPSRSTPPDDQTPPAAPLESPPERPAQRSGPEAVDPLAILRADLADLAPVTREVGTAVVERLEARIRLVLAAIEARFGSPASQGTPVRPAPAGRSPAQNAMLLRLVDELEGLSLRPRCGRRKDLRRIAQFLDSAERALRIRGVDD